MIKCILGREGERVVRIVFSIIHYFIPFTFLVSLSRKMRKMDTLDRICFSSSYIHSFERRVELIVGKKKLFPVTFIVVSPLIFNSIETPRERKTERESIFSKEV